MTSTASALVLLLASAGGAVGEAGGSVALSLDSDQRSYHVGEAVTLTLTVTNTGHAPVFGYMTLRPYLPPDFKNSTLWYCRNEACVEFLGAIPGIEEREMQINPMTLEPGRSHRSLFAVAYNPKTGSLVLDAPGDYEFRWVTWAIHDRRGLAPLVRGEEQRASAFVRVLPVPPSELAAYNYYVQHTLAELAQYDPGYFRYTDALHQAAHIMLARFPDSIYADAVRLGFRKLLESRVRRGRATPEDQAALIEMRARVTNKRD
jgi:uncharacterized repeat protein (TIGR01451 family)